MAYQRIAVIFFVAVGGLFLVGCQCNRDEFTSFCDNLGGAPWRETMNDCKRDMDHDNSTWRSTILTDLSGFDRNLSGADWRRNVIGNYGCPTGGNPTGPGQKQ